MLSDYQLKRLSILSSQIWCRFYGYPAEGQTRFVWSDKNLSPFYKPAAGISAGLKPCPISNYTSGSRYLYFQTPANNGRRHQQVFATCLPYQPQLHGIFEQCFFAPSYRLYQRKRLKLQLL